MSLYDPPEGYLASANEDLNRIRQLNIKGFRSVSIPIGFPAKGDGQALENAISVMCDSAEKAIANFSGVRVFV